MRQDPNYYTLGYGLSLIGETFYRKDIDINKRLRESAKILESLCDEGLILRKEEPIILAISALAYDTAGEGPKSRRVYLKLKDVSPLPLNDAFQSKELSRLFTDLFCHFGIREFWAVKNRATAILDHVAKMQTNKTIAYTHEHKDDFIIAMQMLDLFLAYQEVISKEKPLDLLNSNVNHLKSVLSAADAEQWLILIGRLASSLINSIVRRSILNLKLSEPVESRLIERNTVELWEPQLQAVEKGILEGNNLLLCTGTATGKSFLASIVASQSSPSQKTIYIAPYRTLTGEMYERLKDILKNTKNKVAISTREETRYDNLLDEYSVVVATFEKYNALLKRGLVEMSKIKSLIADEVHMLSNAERGIPLEFTLTRTINQEGNGRTQIIALSGMINSRDADSFSKWLKSDSIRSEWRPVDLDEIIFFNGRLYHKGGQVTDAGFNVPHAQNAEEQRFRATVRLVRDILVSENGQSMVVMWSRTGVVKWAQKLAQELKSSEFFDPDLAKVRSENAERKKKYAEEILRSEPQLPVYAELLAKLLLDGIGFHHAGLPAKYRSVVEDAVRDKVVNVLFATSTFEAGVNLPVTAVIFPAPRQRVGRYRGMSVSTYSNLAGRAGRPGYDVSGKSILVALSEDELDLLKKKYFEEEPSLSSGIRHFLRNVPGSRYEIQSEILGMLSRKTVIDKEEIWRPIERTWFWLNSDEQQRNSLRRHFDTEIYKLRKYGCIQIEENRIKITQTGNMANKSMLYAFSVVNLLNNAKRILSGNYRPVQFDILVLSLAGIPYEMHDNDEIIKEVRIAKEVEFVSKVIKQDEYLREQYDRSKYCPHYGTILWYWINSNLSSEILEKCGLDASHSAFIEETVKQQASWFLSSLTSLSSEITGITTEQKTRIKELAEYCEYGTSDPVILELLKLGLTHMGRNTAIVLGEYLKELNKKPSELKEEEVIQLYPNNKEAAKLLFFDLERFFINRSSERSSNMRNQ